jgi:4-amino-4-deoxy-L-arabinose transferase-like glycosyltransferase
MNPSVAETSKSQTGTNWKQNRNVLLAFGALVLVALALRLLTFDRYWPWLDFSDESNMVILGQNVLGVDTNTSINEWLVGYPPLYPWINAGVQRLTDAVWPEPWVLMGDYVLVLRFVSAMSGVLTTVLAITIGWQLGGPIAGWFAGLVWAISYYPIEIGNLAFADPFVFLFFALSLTAAIRAWKTVSPGWAFASLIAAILAIYTKYTPIYALIPWGIVTIMLIRKNWRRMVPWLVVEAIISAVSVAYLVFGHGALSLSNREANFVREAGLGLFVDLPRLWENFSLAVLPLGLLPFLIGILLAIPAWLYSRRRGWFTVPLNWIAIILVVAYVAFALGGGYPSVDVNETKIRHTLPLTVAMAAVWGAGIAQIIVAIKGLLPQYTKALPVFVVAAVSVLVAVPQLPRTLDSISKYARTENRPLFWQWSDINVPNDGTIVVHNQGQLERLWNRQFGGYDGVKAFNWTNLSGSDLEQMTPQELTDAGIAFFAASEDDLEGYYGSEGVHELLEQFTLIKKFEPEGNLAGPDAIFMYRVQPPENETDTQFGDQIRLVGYDLNTTTVAPGQEIVIRPYWRINEQPDNNYSMYVHIYPADVIEIVAQYDGAPTTPQRLTLTWDDTDELYIGPDVRLAIPEGTEPGQYRIAIGLYDFVTGARLQTQDGAEFFAIPIEVQP